MDWPCKETKKITKMSCLVLTRDSHENQCLAFHSCFQSLFAFVQMQTDRLRLNFISELTPSWGYGYQSEVVKNSFVPHLDNANVLSLVKVGLPCEKNISSSKLWNHPRKGEGNGSRSLTCTFFFLKTWVGRAMRKWNDIF